ncbi:hypothetical protein GGF46_004264 [Coemansia sp. RSA 552]|nr:hypothetical protein GGF46_004264 [Coemansia sp. RSA 552]
MILGVLWIVALAGCLALAAPDHTNDNARLVRRYQVRPEDVSASYGGGGSSGNQVEYWYGDDPDSDDELFGNSPGYNAGGKPQGTGDSSRPFTPRPEYAGEANYITLNYGQTLPPATLKRRLPDVYYGSLTRKEYPGAWSYGFYQIYPYPWWAYGKGHWLGATYKGDMEEWSIYKRISEFRNITVDNRTSIPLIGNHDIFDSEHEVTFVDFNNGTVAIAPCGNTSPQKLDVSKEDCGEIRIDMVQGTVLEGNAQASIHDGITFFELRLGDRTAVLRTLTMMSVQKKIKGGPLAGIIVGSIAGFLLIVVASTVVCVWRSMFCTKRTE